MYVRQDNIYTLRVDSGVAKLYKAVMGYSPYHIAPEIPAIILNDKYFTKACIIYILGGVGMTWVEYMKMAAQHSRSSARHWFRYNEPAL